MRIRFQLRLPLCCAVCPAWRWLFPAGWTAVFYATRPCCAVATCWPCMFTARTSPRRKAPGPQPGRVSAACACTRRGLILLPWRRWRPTVRSVATAVRLGLWLCCAASLPPWRKLMTACSAMAPMRMICRPTGQDCARLKRVACVPPWPKPG